MNEIIKKNFLQGAREIKEKRKKIKLSEDIFMGWIIGRNISYYFSYYFIKKGVIPNKITLKMIYSGIIGAFLFSFPNLYIKIIGVLFMHLWYTLDYSDGEVARETNTFSKYGQELDYMAHIINHPLFSAALCISLIQEHKYNIYVPVLICSLSTILDLIIRNLYAFDIIVNLKKTVKSEHNIDICLLRKIRRILIGIFIGYPNIPLLGSIIYFVDKFFNSNILIYYIILNIILTSLILIKLIIKYTKNLLQ